MLIARLQQPYRIMIDEIEKPEIGPHEILIQVAACGICATDVEAYVGKAPRGWNIEFPFSMGHELSGTVAGIGREVSDFSIGDPVVADGRMSCGSCYYCRRGNFTACSNQSYFSGGFAQYSKYPYQNLVKIPAGLSLEEAALAEPLACVIKGLSTLRVPFGATAVIIGDGPIGLMHMQLLHHRGAYTVVVGLLKHRLVAAKKLGANLAIDAHKEEVGKIIRQKTDGRGADIVVCAVGSAEVISEALDIAARGGSILYFGATLAPEIALDLDLIHYKELHVVGSYDSTIAHYEQALSVMLAGIVAVKPLITHRLSLTEAAKGFEIARQRKGLKVLLIHQERLA